MASWFVKMVALLGAAAAVEYLRTVQAGGDKPDINGTVPPQKRQPVPSAQPVRASEPQPASSGLHASDTVHAATDDGEVLQSEQPDEQEFFTDTPVTQEEFDARTDVFRPESKLFAAAQVEQITLTEQEAAAAGWHFVKKSRHNARIRRYTGTETDLTVPAKIGGYTVNEIGQQFLHGRQDIQTVRIPATVKKLADGIFADTGIRKCIFAYGPLELPERTFAGCSKLSFVHLPYNLQYIRKDAFYQCRSLRTLHLPPLLHQTDEDAFRESGLESFTVRDYDFLFFHFGTLMDGSAIAHTPLGKKYNIVCNFKSDHYLLLKPGKYRFPPSRARFFQHSLPAEGLLDLRDCTGCWIDLRAAQEPQPGAVKGNLKMRLPESWNLNPQREEGIRRIPSQIQIFQRDGQPYPDGAEMRTDADGTKTVLFRRLLAPHGIRATGAEMLIQEPGSGRLIVCEHAVAESKLKTVRFHDIAPQGEIFDACCTALHTVCWHEDGCEIMKYIPPVECIGRDQHAALMQAFTLRQDGIFFDAQQIERVFSSDTYRLPAHENPEGSVTIRINQRTKILTAIDMLRGTHRACDPSLAVYAKYLSSHMRYAKILAKKYPAYDVDYLDYFTLGKISRGWIDWHPAKKLTGKPESI